MTFSASDIPNLSGKVAIVTGGNSGIGLISSKELAAHGAKVYLAARSEEKANEAIEEIKQAYPEANIQFLKLDLTELASVKAAAEQFTASNDRLDILLNNAGVMATPYSFTKDGIELQIGTNVVGHYLFSILLLPTLVQTSKLPEYEQNQASVRIVQLSSLAHTMAPKDTSFKDLETVNKQYTPEVKGTWTRYAISKLGPILTANELKRILPEDARVSNLSLHPGVIKTGLSRGPTASYGSIFGSIFGVFASILFTTPAKGALTQLYACTSPEIDSKKLNGAYLVPTAKVAQASELARDPEGRLGGELFKFCSEIVKEKVGVDVAEVLARANLKPPASHL